MRNIMPFLVILFFILSSYNAFGQQDWQLQKEQNNIKLWTKSLDGTKLLQFKAETYIKADLEALYNLMRNVESMHKWYDKVKKVVLLKKNSDSEGIYLLEYGLPLPFENRVSTLKGSISFDKIKGLIKVNSDYYHFKIPETYQDYPLISQIKSSWEIESVTNGMIRIVHSGYMNPGGNIPLWVTNESVTSAPIKSLSNLKKLLKVNG
ncbi:MAG: hypothetical protein IPK35_02240 [Saprospiraceae bacterium]|jgi:hypothetical protein|nr:hypothetical protein [Saprospiraceae bacterium]